MEASKSDLLEVQQKVHFSATKSSQQFKSDLLEVHFCLLFLIASSTCARDKKC
jgi:hypothetical protein